MFCQHLRLLSPACSSADSRGCCLFFFDAPAPQNTPSLALCSAQICSRGCFGGGGAIWSGHRASCSAECDSGSEAPRDAIKAVFDFQQLLGGTQSIDCSWTLTFCLPHSLPLTLIPILIPTL